MKEAMELRLCFAQEEEGRRPPTSYEINELAIAAQGIEAIVEVMADYTCGNTGEWGDKNAVSNCLSVLNVLGWLIKPIANYLENYAGKPEALEEEPPKEST